MGSEVRGMSPLFEIRGREDPDHELLGVGNDHHPVVFIPDDFRVTELV